MEESLCASCQAVVRSRQQAIQCEDCHQWQHRTCQTGISQANYRKAVRGELELSWKCQACSVQIVYADAPPAETSPTAPALPSDLMDVSPLLSPQCDLLSSIREYALFDFMEDQVPIIFDTESCPITYEITAHSSLRGRDKLHDSRGYSYTVKRKCNDHVDWRCSLRNKHVNCPATVKQCDGVFVEGRRAHIHPPKV